MNATYFVTGGAGFIGAEPGALPARARARSQGGRLRRLTYAGNLDNLERVADDPRYRFVHGDIGDRALVAKLLRRAPADAIVNFAAEIARRPLDRRPGRVRRDQRRRHVRAARGGARATGESLSRGAARALPFLHVSTDEVYGSLGPDGPLHRDDARTRPTRRTAASKAAADHLVRAYHHTYGLPTLITNCSNNYGPYQFPEKLIPLMILNALEGKPLPVYGDGENVRDWLYVDDHCAALHAACCEARQPGETYNVGGGNERTNLEVVRRASATRSIGSGAAQSGGSYRDADHVRHRPPGPRPPLRHRRHQDRARARLARRATTFEDGIAQDRGLVSRAPRLVRAHQQGHYQRERARASAGGQMKGSSRGRRGHRFVR